MYILISITSYLLGSIPSAYLLGKIYQIDIRTKGSGNVGTMNTRAALGWRPALLVLVMDLAKGMTAVYLAHIAGVDLMFAASMAVIGHVYPVWLKFKGGKGLAVAAGALIAAGSPLTVIVFPVFFLLTYPLVKKDDLISLLGTAAAAIISTIFYGWDGFLILLALIICIKHIGVMIKNNKDSKKISG